VGGWAIEADFEDFGGVWALAEVGGDGDAGEAWCGDEGPGAVGVEVGAEGICLIDEGGGLDEEG
jgi:hypothetical protein